MTAAVERLQKSYLRRFGWKNTSNNPGSYWLWKRDFSDLDAKRRAWWEAACAEMPKLGNPSEPVPYGVITADTDLAIIMTAKELDRESEGDDEDDEDPHNPAEGSRAMSHRERFRTHSEVFWKDNAASDEEHADRVVIEVFAGAHGPVSLPFEWPAGRDDMRVVRRMLDLAFEAGEMHAKKQIRDALGVKDPRS